MSMKLTNFSLKKRREQLEQLMMHSLGWYALNHRMAAEQEDPMKENGDIQQRSNVYLRFVPKPRPETHAFHNQQKSTHNPRHADLETVPEEDEEEEEDDDDDDDDEEEEDVE